MKYKLVRQEWGRVAFVFGTVYNTKAEAKQAKRRIEGMSQGTCRNLRIVEAWTVAFADNNLK